MESSSVNSSKMGKFLGFGFKYENNRLGTCVSSGIILWAFSNEIGFLTIVRNLQKMTALEYVCM